MKVVFNTSPIIILGKLQLLEKAFTLFPEIYIPSGVIKEFGQKLNPDENPIKSITDQRKIQIKTVKETRFYLRLREILGKGETEAILLGLELDADFVILDDKAARNKAVSFGLNIKGAVGILRKLYQEKLISSAPDDIFVKLQEHNFRIQYKIYKKILLEFYEKK